MYWSFKKKISNVLYEDLNCEMASNKLIEKSETNKKKRHGYPNYANCMFCFHWEALFSSYKEMEQRNANAIGRRCTNSKGKCSVESVNWKKREWIWGWLTWDIAAASMPGWYICCCWSKACCMRACCCCNFSLCCIFLS